MNDMMNMNSDFESGDHVEVLRVSANDFDKIRPAKTPNFFNFESDSIGSGTFGSFSPKKGIRIFYICFIPGKNFVWHSPLIDNRKNTLFFNYILEAPEGIRSSVGQHNSADTLSANTLLIDATKSDRKSLKLVAGQKIELLQIGMSEVIFSDYIKALIPKTTEAIKNHIHIHSFKPNKAGYMLPLDLKEERCIREIIHCPTKAGLQRFFTLLKISELMMRYFSKIINRDISGIISTEKISLSEKDVIAKIKKHVDENIKNDLDVNLYSAMYQMSANHIKSLFRNIYGYSLSTYHRKKKLNEAYSMLLDTADKKSIKEITFSLGFTSIASFSRSFYNEFKIRPSDINLKFTDLNV